MSSIKSAADEKWKHAKHPLTRADFRDEEGEPQLSTSVVDIDRPKYPTKDVFVRMLPLTRAVKHNKSDKQLREKPSESEEPPMQLISPHISTSSSDKRLQNIVGGFMIKVS